MRIAFLSPKWNELVNSYPPLGLGYLAAQMESEGHQVAIFDLGLEPQTALADDVARIVSWRPDLIGVTAMTNNYHSAEETMALLKERIGCPIVCGGPHATVYPEKVCVDAHVDYVIYGEGEATLVELVRALEREGARPSSETLAAIQGLCYSLNGQVRCNPARPLIQDLDALAIPARHLFELGRYPLFDSDGERMVTLLSSRGCPYNCSYCFKGIVGRTYRQRSPQNIIAEIRHLMGAYGYRSFYFIDDLFTIDRRRLGAITEAMIAERLDIHWQCLARVDRVTPDLLRKMRQAGCREVHYGIETGNAEILAQLGKHITLEQVRNAVAWTAQVGILSKGYFMLGLPGDSEETMQQTIQFASELELDEAMFSLTTPFPGTRLWDELVARQPEIEFNQDFSRAYYYNRYDKAIKPFFNLSTVSDERLAQLAIEARLAFEESKRKRKYLRTLGPALGGLAYSASRWRPLRAVAHRLLKTSLARRIPGLNCFGASAKGKA